MKKEEQLVHFVSTGPKFPYMYYIGIMTALKVYGDKVRLWVTEEPQSEYFEALKGKVTINKIDAKNIPEFPALANKDDYFKRVAVFDYLIWDIVYKLGGIIMGLDSMTLKPHFDLLEAGKELMAPRDTEENPKSFAMHGVIVRKGSELAKLIINDARESLNSSDMKWGDSGIRPFVTRSLQNLDKVSVVPPGLCAGFTKVRAPLYVFRDDAELLRADTRTIPLYAFSSLPDSIKIDGRYVADGSSLYAKLARSVLSEREWNPLKKSTMWLKAVGWEKHWWGDCANTYHEEIKQLKYASLMGVNQSMEVVPRIGQGFQFNLKGKSVLDIGGGPISLLLKAANFGRAVVVDPCEFPDWILERYKAHGIEFINKPAEEVDLHGFDEVWIYNVLQHVIDPDEVLKRAKKAGKVVRIFEWVNTAVSEGHINNLTKTWLDKYFNGKLHTLNGESGCYGTAYVDVWGKEEKKEKKEVTVRTEKKQKRFHLLGLPHLATNKKEACACAYSQKILKMGKMLKSSGHKVFFYGIEGSTVECDEFIQVSTKEVLRKTYGDYDYKSEMYKFDTKDLAYRTFNENAIREINKRKQGEDFLLLPFGYGHKVIADAVNIGLTVESGIGYMDTFAKYRVFESYAWMHYLYGRGKVADGKFYDCVIPNYFDPKDFEYRNKKGDYFLYLGRLIKRKGLQIAKEMIEAIGGKLVLAGQKGTGQDFIDISAPYMEYVGFVGFKERKELLSKAKAVLVPTTYIGPFEGVSIEAAFSGTPVITTDHGCFAENVLHGITGYRCRTLEQFIFAAKNIHRIKPKDCRMFAMKNFTLERVAKMYDEYWDQLLGLFGDGWYTKNPERKNLDWLKREYPK